MGHAVRGPEARAASSTARRGDSQSTHEDKIAGGSDERAPCGDLVRAAVHGASKSPHHFHPAEALLNLFADALTGLVTGRPSCAPIQALDPAFLNLGHMRSVGCARCPPPAPEAAAGPSLVH